MEDIRHQLLQAELKRIEDRAEENSIAIMNKADALLAAHVLCQRINEAKPGIYEFSPEIVYQDQSHSGCSIMIMTGDEGDVFLRRCRDLGLAMEATDVADSYATHMRVNDYKGVEVVVRTSFVAMREILDAAATSAAA